MDRTRKQTKGDKSSAGKSGRTKKDKQEDITNETEGQAETSNQQSAHDETSSDVPESEGMEAEGEESKMGTRPLSADKGEKGKIVDLPNSLGQRPDQGAKSDPTRPLDEEDLRELLVDLRNDITTLKKEQDETVLPAPDGEAHLYDLLAALKDDIHVLKSEQEHEQTQPDEAQMFALLAELKNDMNALKEEQEATLHTDGEEHLYGLLSELKSDINILKAEQEHQMVPAHEAHLYELLADLKSDIKVLKAEQPLHAHEREEEHLYGVLAELKSDISVLKAEHELAPVPYAGRVPAAPARSSALRYMLSGALVTLLVMGAGAGGYVFSVYQQGGDPLAWSSALLNGDNSPASEQPAKTIQPLAEGKEAKAAIPAITPSTPKRDGGLASDSAARTVAGQPGEPVELKINLTGAEVKPETAIVLLGIPENMKLSSGNRTEKGEWMMTVWDTLRLTLTAPQKYAGDFGVTVALMDSEGVLTDWERFNVNIGGAEMPAKPAQEPVVAEVKSDPAPAPAPAIQPQLSTDEQKELIARAGQLIDQGDVVSARNVLDYAVGGGSADAAYKLAQTYDPAWLNEFKSVLGVKPDLIKAKVLYYFAARNGHEEASKRLAVLRKSTPSEQSGN